MGAVGVCTRRGRPPLAQPSRVYTIKLRLRPGEDDDLVAFLEAIPLRSRAAAVKAALRSGRLVAPAAAGPADGEMAAALDALLL